MKEFPPCVRSQRHIALNINYLGRILLLSFLLAFTFPVQAITIKDADNCYRKGNYQQAISDYKELLSKGVSAELYYNLGNAYYRSDNLPRAILCYERALLLSPGNEDIRFNLQFARSKTIDKIVPESEMFYVTWYRSVRNLTSIDHWAYMGIISVAVALVLVLFYLFASSILLRKLSFFGGIFLFVFFIVSTFFAFQQKYALENRTGAIIMATSVNVKKSPVSNSDDSFILHEGTRVDITDKGINGWRGIRVGDGRTGWVLTSQLEQI